MAELPESVHWRIHLEMADLCKREKNFKEARKLYTLATRIKPTAPQVTRRHSLTTTTAAATTTTTTSSSSSTSTSTSTPQPEPQPRWPTCF